MDRTGDAAGLRSPLRRGLLMAAAASLPGVARAQADGPVVRVRQGLLRGVRGDGWEAYKGVPYAAPPVGALRFRPPQEAAPWTGVREAAAFAAASLQPPPPPGLGAELLLGVTTTSEDCLFLNVWRPAAPGPHPVFVWIHGGGNMAGSAAQVFDGAAFARDGIVCVTVGYRLGTFGFLELGGLLGPTYAGSGVNGLRDQLAALRWVRDNISAFGGDPRRVTLGGQSAGAKDVVALMASPLAGGLFASAVVESGGQTVHDLPAARAAADLLFRPAAAAGARAADLLTMPGEQLNVLQIGLLKAYDRPFPFRPVTGTDVLPQAPLQVLGARAGPARRLLIGTNRDESILFIDRRSANAPLAQHDLANLDLATARRIADAYERASPGLDALLRRVRFLSAEEYGAASADIAAARTRFGPVWSYRWDEEVAAGPFEGWAPHGAELPYVWSAFDNPLVRLTYGEATPAQRRLGDEIHARWTAFIAGGAPDAAGKPVWPRYDGERILRVAADACQAAQVDPATRALSSSLVPVAPSIALCCRET